MQGSGWLDQDPGRSHPGSIVFLVDDEPSVRRALSRLLRTAGHGVESFASAGEFLAQMQGVADERTAWPREVPGPGPGPSCLHGSTIGNPGSPPCCLVLDIRMPGLDGMELQEMLAGDDCCPPIVFITGHGDVPTSVKAMKRGAVDFLVKPVDEADLLLAVDRALARDRSTRRLRAEALAIHSRAARLTRREREVMGLVVRGLLNKQIAAELGIAEKTVKVHRGRVMEKMQARSAVELVRLAGLPRTESGPPDLPPAER